jgi:hypothetical protein
LLAVPGKKLSSASGPPIEAMAKPVKRSGETGFDISASTAHLGRRIRQTAARDRAYPVQIGFRGKEWNWDVG